QIPGSRPGSRTIPRSTRDVAGQRPLRRCRIRRCKGRRMPGRQPFAGRVTPWQDSSAYWHSCLSMKRRGWGGSGITMPVQYESPVMSIAAADSLTALDHFEKLLGVETDCWDVHFDLEHGKPEFVLLDVRSPESFAAGHIEGARNLPHRQIDVDSL